jgi:hypothetical protein
MPRDRSPYLNWVTLSSQTPNSPGELNERNQDARAVQLWGPALAIVGTLANSFSGAIPAGVHWPGQIYLW